MEGLSFIWSLTVGLMESRHRSWPLQAGCRKFDPAYPMLSVLGQVLSGGWGVRSGGRESREWGGQDNTTPGVGKLSLRHGTQLELARGSLGLQGEQGLWFSALPWHPNRACRLDRAWAEGGRGELRLVP